MVCAPAAVSPWGSAMPPSVPERMLAAAAGSLPGGSWVGSGFIGGMLSGLLGFKEVELSIAAAAAGSLMCG